jgi:hypothetical protein
MYGHTSNLKWFLDYLATFFGDSHYVASNDGVISESLVGKDVEGNSRDLILRY